MTNKRNVWCNKIRSAKSWLNRAEDSFANENDVQGELNLLLAQAELKHLHEKKKNSWQKKGHIVALFTAAFMAVGVFGAWKMYSPNIKKESSSPSTVVQNVIKDDKINLLTADYVKSQNIQKVQPVVENTVLAAERLPVHSDEENTVIEQKAVFSDGEMKELVRTAGKVLRGNN